jgi:hypothetical protein
MDVLMQSRDAIAQERHPIDLFYASRCSVLCGKGVLVGCPICMHILFCAWLLNMHGKTCKHSTASFIFHCSTV